MRRRRYNKTHPSYYAQTLVATLLAGIGIIIQAYILGEVGLLIATLNAEQTRMNEKMDNIDRAMNYMKLTPELQDRVRLFMEYAFSVYGANDPGNQWLWELSDSLHSEILITINADLIHKVPLFAGAKQKFIEAVVMCFKHSLYM